MKQELRIYGVKDGKMAEWARLFRDYVAPFHAEKGFRVRAAWLDGPKNQFVWVRDVGSESDMAAFTKALCTTDFLARCADIGVTVAETRQMDPLP
jgi:hypothetical protein